MPRPHKFTTSAQLAKEIEDYLDDCDGRDKPPTMSGLTFWLGYEDRQALYKLKSHKRFGSVIKSYTNKIISAYEENLSRVGNNSGSIFWLKNHGWSDTIDISMQQAPTINFVVSKETKEALGSAVSSLDADD